MRAARLRLDVDVVVHGFGEPLLAAEIAFRCFHGDVPESAVAPVGHSDHYSCSKPAPKSHATSLVTH